jgi:hypothetical protein
MQWLKENRGLSSQISHQKNYRELPWEPFHPVIGLATSPSGIITTRFGDMPNPLHLSLWFDLKASATGLVVLKKVT